MSSRVSKLEYGRSALSNRPISRAKGELVCTFDCSFHFVVSRCSSNEIGGFFNLGFVLACVLLVHLLRLMMKTTLDRDSCHCILPLYNICRKGCTRTWFKQAHHRHQWKAKNLTSHHLHPSALASTSSHNFTPSSLHPSRPYLREAHFDKSSPYHHLPSNTNHEKPSIPHSMLLGMPPFCSSLPLVNFITPSRM